MASPAGSMNPMINQNPEDMAKQFREFLVTYNKISEMCFADCIHDFTTRSPTDKEQTCVVNCMEKYLKMSQRLSLRFAEHQVQLNEAQMALAQANPTGRK